VNASQSRPPQQESGIDSIYKRLLFLVTISPPAEQQQQQLQEKGTADPKNMLIHHPQSLLSQQYL
jgi:hypothetical protein